MPLLLLFDILYLKYTSLCLISYFSVWIIVANVVICFSFPTYANGRLSSSFAVLIIFAMLFAGFFIGSNQIPAYIRWGQYLSYIKYAFAAMGQTMLGVCADFGLRWGRG